MPDLDLAAIRARVEATTPGPWRARVWPQASFTATEAAEWEVVEFEPDRRPLRYARITKSGDYGDLGRSSDAEFIAHAREDIPVLLAEVERLTARVAAARARLDVATGALRTIRSGGAVEIWIIQQYARDVLTRIEEAPDA